MDFYKITATPKQNGYLVVAPEFIINSKDLMTKGKSFYAAYDDETNMWITDIYKIIRRIDRDIFQTCKSLTDDGVDPNKLIVKDINSYSSGSWRKFIEYLSSGIESYQQLDNKPTFLNTDISKTDYVSKRLPYALESGSYESWDKIMGTLYEPEERQKLEWAIGAVVTGDLLNIQKFIVLYGAAGSGKSTFLNIVQGMFDGYHAPFDAKALVGSSQFATEAFRSNPLLAIQHDGDLSHIEDNSKLNSIVSHEELIINEKYKSTYSIVPRAMIFLGTNTPVMITNQNSGLIRRLIDVRPSGNKIPKATYDILMQRVKFEYGAIAWHCKEVYESLGRSYYDNYIPTSMMFKTDSFYNFVEEHYLLFKNQDGCSLRQAWQLYKEYCNQSSIYRYMPMYKFREELKNYFKEYFTVYRLDGKQIRSYYKTFLVNKFENEELEEQEEDKSVTTSPFLELGENESIFDKNYADCTAQLANRNGVPSYKWADVQTKLKDIDTSQVHYVLLPENVIVIDFDLKDETTGEKSLELNLKEAAKWPPTYAELSKSGQGLHLHYIYNGDSTKLSRIYDVGIEIKVFTGNSSLRRKLTKCNALDISTINSGLPIKEVKMINFDVALSENRIRDLITRNLTKEFHAGTKPSIDFIYYILQQQYDLGTKYDVSDMAQAVTVFASHSTHHAPYCLKMVSKMKFKSDSDIPEGNYVEDSPLVFFDCEVFPNLFLVNWKYAGEGHKVVRMINPTSADMEEFLKKKLVGFNNLRYDNHLLYACWIGYTGSQLYYLSKRIIEKDNTAFFRAAYNISYTDVYDFSSVKKSLKRWEIDLGIHHQELGYSWDEPVPEKDWVKVAEYCDNDVISTEAVFNHLEGDWKTRQLLAKMTGMSVNTTTNNLAIKFVFGDEAPDLIYTDLATGIQYGPGEPGPYDKPKITFGGSEGSAPIHEP